MSINHFLADELANKVINLTKALNQAQKTISALEHQNQCLKDVLVDLTSKNKDHMVMVDSCCEEPVCSRT